VSNTAVGGGVRLAQVSQQFAQGNIEFTNNNLDLAINGEGFYVLDDGGSKVFTRAGAFKVDREGYVVNSSSQRLQVFSPIGNSSTAFNTGSLNNLQISLTEGAPNATASVDMSINLNASDTSAGTVAAFDPATPASYDYSTSYTVYDSLGAQHTATMYFLKDNVANNTWHTWLYADNGTASTNVTQGGAASSTLTFASDGALATVNGAAATTLTYDNLAMSNGAAPLAMTLDYADLTQFGGDFAVNSLSQDGFATGRLTGLDLDDTGVVSARYTNGQSTALGKVALANFANVQGLRQLGETNWAETFGSGGALIGEAGTASFGLIQSGALESSNVDIAEQLINLITAQRNFQANSQVISTADTVTQTIINIR
jgi:flagellar hook protein FlgE